jgi:hypothetical protein
MQILERNTRVPFLQDVLAAVVPCVGTAQGTLNAMGWGLAAVFAVMTVLNAMAPRAMPGESRGLAPRRRSVDRARIPEHDRRIRQARDDPFAVGREGECLDPGGRRLDRLGLLLVAQAEDADDPARRLG